MYSLTNPRIDHFAGRSVLETAVVALGATLLWFGAVVTALAAASVVSEEPLLALSVTVAVGLAVFVAGVAGATRVTRWLVGTAGWNAVGRLRPSSR